MKGDPFMEKRQQREKDMLNLIKGLDISHTMYENARKKYQTLGKELNERGIECDVLPQGSFSTGTVIRPFKNGKDADYDLDAVCVINIAKTSTTPQNIKKMIGNVLKKCGHYEEVSESDECWTINFAENNGIGFNIDVVTSAVESIERKEKLKMLATPDASALIDKSVAMANGLHDSKSSSWKTINPDGFKDWFDIINERFVKYTREQQFLLEKDKVYAGKIKPIPTNDLRSSLQIAIQIMKRHRDVYYFNNHIENLKPISAIITTLAAKIASESSQDSLTPLGMLGYILENIDRYQGLVCLHESVRDYSKMSLIKKHSGKWILTNPVNPDDNLLDSWNDNTAEVFFKWTQEIKRCFLDSLALYEKKAFFEAVSAGLGKDYVTSSPVYKESMTPILAASVPNVEIGARKPWRDKSK